MKWIREQAWCLVGGSCVAAIMTAFHFYKPTSHSYIAMLIGSSLIVGTLIGLHAGLRSLVWVLYSIAAFLLFNKLEVHPFASHDLPASVVVGLTALYATPSGLIGASLGVALRLWRNKLRTEAARN